MNETYAEWTGHRKTDYGRKLESISRRLNAEMDEEWRLKISKRLRILAWRCTKWETCAVGNQSALIPRDEQGLPFDNELYKAGVAFEEQIERAVRAIEQGDWLWCRVWVADALKSLATIEKVSAEIVRYAEEDVEDELEEMELEKEIES